MISKRLKKKNGKIFMPMNMSVNTDSENFMNVPKLIVTALLVVASFVFGNFIMKSRLNLIGYIIYMLVFILIFQLVVRYIIVEETYFSKMYAKHLANKRTKLDVIWKISSVRNTPEGAILMYNTAKIGCVIRLERDTIVGKASDNEELHADAWSDFYRELNEKKLAYVQLNLMELAEKDKRINDLANIASNVENENLRLILEQEVGYIKEISRATLSENDYILIYRNSANKMDSLIEDVKEAAAQLLKGAYSDVVVLSEKDIYDLPKSMYNTEYFDGIGAQINVYKNNNTKIKPVVSITSITFSDASSMDIGDRERKVISKLTSLVKDGSLKYGEWSLKEALNGRMNIINFKNKTTHSELVDDTNYSDIDSTENDNKKVIKSTKTGKRKRGKNQKLEQFKEDENYLEDSMGIDLSILDELDDETDLMSEE